MSLTGEQVLAAGLDDWRQLTDGLHTRFATGDFVTGVRLVDAICDAAEKANHHPDVDLRYPHVDVTLTSHDVGALTERDLGMARTISEIAATLGVRADPTAVSLVEIGLDSAAHEEIKPFWRAVLGLDDRKGVDDEVADPSGRLPSLWFQQTDAHDEPRQRFHLDVHVAHDAAERRVADAIAAGGTLVTDQHAPSFWVLADAQGNKACVCTWQDRG